MDSSPGKRSDFVRNPNHIDVEHVSEKLYNILKQIAETCQSDVAMLLLPYKSDASVIASFGENDTLRDLTKEVTIASHGDTDTEKTLRLSDISGYQPKDEAPGFYMRLPVFRTHEAKQVYLCVSDYEEHELSETQTERLHLYADSLGLLLQILEQQTIINRYSRHLDNSADATYIIDGETGQIESSFHDPQQIFGRPAEELKGKRFSELVGKSAFSDEPVEQWFRSIDPRNGQYILESQLSGGNDADRSTWLNCSFTKRNGAWLVSINDITDKKEAQEKVDRLRDTFAKVVQVATDLIYELDWQSGKLSWGNELTNVLGYPDSERFVDYDWWLDKIHPEDLEHVIRDVAETVTGENSKLKLVYRIRTYDGDYKYVMNRTHVERDADGTPSDVVGAIVDISDLVKSKELSEHHRRSLEQLTENAWSATWIRDESGRFIFSNGKYRELFDLGVEDVTGKHLSDLFDTDAADKKQQRDAKVIQTQDPLIYEKEISIDGEKKFYKVNLFPMHGMPGLKDLVGGVAVDITTEKRSRQEVETSLKEKETLLKEIHHRVKNNLSVVSGMIQLQAFKEKDESVRRKLFASTGRIKTMAMIHELLYNTVSFTDLRFDENIKKLISGITDTYEASVDLDLDYDLDPVNLNINQAIPCSLIVNEVVTNVLKHAYHDGDTGNLKVILNENGENVLLKIRDDGRGLPDDFDTKESSDSLGMELIETLSNQISGDYSYNSLSDGTEFCLVFNKRGIPKEVDTL